MRFFKDEDNQKQLIILEGHRFNRIFDVNTIEHLLNQET